MCCARVYFEVLLLGLNVFFIVNIKFRLHFFHHGFKLGITINSLKPHAALVVDSGDASNCLEIFIRGLIRQAVSAAKPDNAINGC